MGQHKGAATRMARASGAIQVINNIKVSNSSKETPMRQGIRPALKRLPGQVLTC